MTARPRSIKPLAIGLLLSLVMAACVFVAIPLRTDMAGFLPAGRTDNTRFIMREVQSGSAATVILAAIEGAAPDVLARASQTMADSLAASGLFVTVTNGSRPPDGADEAFLFSHRYLLAPPASARDFSVDALHDDMQAVLDMMESSAEPLAEHYGLADPTGAFMALLRAWAPHSHGRSIDGVWFAPERDRALILLRTRANGMDLYAQKQVQAAISAAYAAAAQPGMHLLMSGPAVFALKASHAMQADVEFLSTASMLLVTAVLIWRFRSPWVLAAMGIAFALSLSVAMVVVRVLFGYVHGISFGFGMTMLGVSLDYPVLLIGHRDQGEAADAPLRRIGTSLRLAVTSACLGLTGMVFCGLPGLAQLGVFSVAGLLSAAATTLWLLPRLIQKADLSPGVATHNDGILRIESWRRYRLWFLILPVIGAGVLAVHPPRRETDIASLSPVPPALRALDAELRHEIGAPDAGQAIIVQAPTVQGVLEREGQLMPVLDALQARGVMGDAEYAARFLPSITVQRARIASLPDTAELTRRLDAARADLPFQPDAFAPFVQDVAATRAMEPLQPHDMTSPLVATRLAPLLFARQGQWFGVILPETVRDTAALATAFATQPDIMVLNMRHETNAIVADHMHQALWWTVAGTIMAVALLALGLRDVRRLARVCVAVGSAGIVIMAAMAVLGVRLSLIHVISLQFVMGVGLDYALFFARPQIDRAERARTLRTLLTCNTMTLLTFGILACCRTPLLRDIGSTVAIGAFLAMLFSFMMAAPVTGTARQVRS
ncbi:hypothetical protein B0W47_10650 [Komagataeibacter nataicola]|uniref:Membrane transport protein MMPL domain-containing protein n=1 Tax=Komagataeibacter nataicola TaxID=265960 RepID=A0A9N7CNN9_9PROT|nr:MMPL family transporter [Komagataeibacter nataicola]AQU87859.1 hypothetical protein B0W47_10650 [Komagataeibacter nataicola]PYD66418.1 hypothetical protein CDI09_07885 [Komagataeibacter nataicola]WEQ55588.1 MMPL family transporter [Komagataeibacter nataicola]GBR26328.1 hypothetical protein AA0616_3186 [Komagataeibacter nataicola NRIC 0616]